MEYFSELNKHGKFTTVVRLKEKYENTIISLRQNSLTGDSRSVESDKRLEAHIQYAMENIDAYNLALEGFHIEGPEREEYLQEKRSRIRQEYGVFMLRLFVLGLIGLLIY